MIDVSTKIPKPCLLHPFFDPFISGVAGAEIVGSYVRGHADPKNFRLY
jgi:hypothetical protein